ncbi:unnamed protein product [Pieris macdunnoughi]|uniref:Uncharacterized protein n=1 Tax=Pieris macdunnoughi TaxID=345717 RepID=A0A821SL71_9NEOP|nr:unnamed protein product [Pieris macdunnoughi]
MNTFTLSLNTIGWIQLREEDQSKNPPWAAYSKLKSVFSAVSLPQCLKSKVFEQCVLLMMSYSSETWFLTSTWCTSSVSLNELWRGLCSVFLYAIELEMKKISLKSPNRYTKKTVKA